MLPVILNIGRVLGSFAIRRLGGKVLGELGKKALMSRPAQIGTAVLGLETISNPEPVVERASHLPEFFIDFFTDEPVNLYNSVDDEDIDRLLRNDIDDELKAKIKNEVFYEDLADRLRELPEEVRQEIKFNIFKSVFRPQWVENPNSTNITKLYQLIKLIDIGVKGKDEVDLTDIDKRIANMYVLYKFSDGNIDKRDIESLQRNLPNTPLIAKQLTDKVKAVHYAENMSSALFFASLLTGGTGGILRVVSKAPITSKFLTAISGATFLGGVGTETLKQPALEGRPLGEILSDPATYFNLWGLSWATSEVVGAKNLITYAKDPIKYLKDKGELEQAKILEGVSVKEFLDNTKTASIEYPEIKKMADVLATLPDNVTKKIQEGGLKPLQNVVGEAIDLSSILSKEEKIALNKTFMEYFLKLPYHLEDISITSKATEEFVNKKLDKILKVAKGELGVVKEDKELKEFFDIVHDNYVLNRMKSVLPSAKKIRLQALHDDNIYKEINVDEITVKDLLDEAKKFGDEYGSYKVIGIIPEETEQGVKAIEKSFNVQRYYVPTNDRFILVRGEDDALYTVPKTYIDNGLIGYTDATGRFIEIKPKEFIIPTDNIFPYLKKAFVKSLEGDVKGLQKVLSELEKTEFTAIKVDKIDDLDKALDKLQKVKGLAEKHITKLKGDVIRGARLLLDTSPAELKHKRSKYGFVKLDELDKDIAKEYLTRKYKNAFAGSSINIVRDLYKFREYLQTVHGARLSEKPILKSLAEAIDNYLKSTDNALGTIHKITATVGALNTMLNPAVKIGNTINAIMTLKMFMPESFKFMRNPDWATGFKTGVKDWLSVSTKDSASLNRMSMIIDPFAILNESYVIGLIAKAGKNPKFVEEATKLLGVSRETVEQLLKTEPDKLYRLIYHTISGFNTFALPTGVLARGFSKANALINWYPFIVKPFANSLEMIKSTIDFKNKSIHMRNAGRLAGISLIGWFTLGGAGVPVLAPVETGVNILGQLLGVVALINGDDTLERISVDPISYITTRLGIDESKEYINEYFKGLGEVLTGYLIQSELIDEQSPVKEIIQKGAEFLGFALTHDLADLGIASAGAGSFAADIPLLNLKVMTDLAYYFKSKAMGIDLPVTYLLRDIAYMNNIGKYALGGKDTAGWEVEKPIGAEVQELFKETVGLSYVVGALMYVGDLATSGYISKVAYAFTKDPDKDKLAFKTKLNSTRDFSKMEEKWDLYAKGVIKLYDADKEGYELFMRRYINVNEKLLEKYLKTLMRRGEIDYKAKRKIENSLKFLSIIADKIEDERVRKLYRGYSLLAERLGISLNEKDKIKLKGALSGAIHQ